MGCVGSKINAFNKDMPNFLAHIKGEEVFAVNLSEGLAEVKRVIEVEPCLVKGFQGEECSKWRRPATSLEHLPTMNSE